MNKLHIKLYEIYISLPQYSRAAVRANSITMGKSSTKPTYEYPKYEAELILQMNLAGLMNKC